MNGWPGATPQMEPGGGSLDHVCHDREVPSDPSTYRELAERAWAWVLTQVRQGDEGMWLTEYPGQTEPGEYGMHSGVGGLAHALEEIRLTRPLGAAELALCEGIGETLVRRIPTRRGTTTSRGSPAPSASSLPSMLRVSSWQSHGSRSSPLQTGGRHPGSRRRRRAWTHAATTRHWARPGSCSALSGRSGTAWPARPSSPNTPSTSCSPNRSLARTAPTGRSSRCASCSPATTCRCRTGRTAKLGSPPHWPPQG